MIHSKMNSTNKKASAKADRLTSIPKNKHKLKKPMSFKKYANRNSVSLKIKLTSLMLEYYNPIHKQMINIKNVAIAEKKTMV